MLTLGYLCCVLIGLSLGLIGAGGSILFVPALVCLFGLSPLVATSYGLWITGVTSSLCALLKFRQGEVLLRPALLFGLSSLLAVVLVRRWVLPLLPAAFGQYTLLLFAGLMVLSALALFKEKTKTERPIHTATLIIYALLVGTLTGLLGVGGGFLIIPVLITRLGMPVKPAVGTSLFIIALNSLSGFSCDLGHVSINWSVLTGITLAGLGGSLVGLVIARHTRPAALKRYFGSFILCLGIVLAVKEIYHLVHL